MPAVFIKLDIDFDLMNDPDPELDPIIERYSPGWDDAISLRLKTDYVIPYGVSLSKDDLVDGFLDVNIVANHLNVKCCGIFKTKLDNEALEAIEVGSTSWHLCGIPQLFGCLGKVSSNGTKSFDPESTPDKDNPSTLVYQRSALCESDVVLGPVVDVLIGKKKSALK